MPFWGTSPFLHCPHPKPPPSVLLSSGSIPWEVRSDPPLNTAVPGGDNLWALGTVQARAPQAALPEIPWPSPQPRAPPRGSPG